MSSGGGCVIQEQDYDFSQIPYIGTLTVFPAYEIGIKVSLGVVVEIIALIGNILVIAIVVKYKHMRTTTNYYLVNLAVSDLLVAIMPVWVHLVQSLNEFWVFGSFLCKFNPFMQITAMCASMFTLMVIAGDRFFAIMYPMKSRVTRRKVSIVLSLVWFTAIAIATPLLFIFYHLERKWLDLKETICAEKWPTKELADGSCDQGLTSKKAYWIVVCGVLNWTPMLCMALAYTFIVVKLQKHKIVPKLGASSKSSVQQRSKRKVVTMLFSVFIVFILCAVPFQTIRIYFLFTVGKSGYKLPEWYPTLDFGAVLLLYSNAAINPVIYAGLNDNFRKGFKDLVNGVIKRNSPSASEEFETEYKQRSTLRAKENSVAIVSAAETAVTLAVSDLSVAQEEQNVNNIGETITGTNIEVHGVQNGNGIVANGISPQHIYHEAKVEFASRL
ncbi:hypothetical protein ACF0H5_000693 [Mactra antiquata]